MVPPANVRRIAPAGSPDEAARRLYQSLYVCTMHSAGLLHAIAAILDAESEGRFSLQQVAARAAALAGEAQLAATDAEQWRYQTMTALCLRLAASR